MKPKSIKNLHKLRDYWLLGTICWTLLIIIFLIWIQNSLLIDFRIPIFFLIPIWFFGIAGIIYFYLRFKQSDALRLKAEKESYKLNLDLEEMSKQGKLELQKLGDEWNSIFNKLGTPAQIINKDHTIKYVNNATLSIFNLSREKLIGAKCFSIFHQNKEAKKNCPLEQALLGNQPIHEDILFEIDNRSFIVSCTPIYNPEGEIDYFMHLMTDISERKEMELRLKESEKKLDIIIETIPLSVILIDEKGIVLACNDGMLKLHAFNSKEEVIGKSFLSFVHSDDKENATKQVSKIRSKESSKAFILNFLRNDGSSFYGELSPSTYFDKVNNKQYIVSAVNDITEGLEAELQYKTIIEQAGDAMYLSDFDGNIMEINHEATREMGYSRDEFLKMKAWELDKVYPDTTTVKNLWETLKLKQAITFESIHKRKNGSSFPVEIRIGLTEIKGKKAVLGFARNIENRKNTENELSKYRLHLEQLVKERTQQLEDKNLDLEQINRLFIGRELRMAELKEEIETLKQKRYK